METTVEPAAHEQLGSYVMSVLTGTMMGQLMSVEEVCAGIVRNGWATPGNGLRSAVEGELSRLRNQGMVLQVGDRYDLSAAAIALIVGDDGVSGGPA